MLRIISLFLVISICFVLQSTTFQYFSLAGISPNLLIIVVSAFGFMRGRKEGMYVGFFCGLLMDIFCGTYLGPYALLYMYIGYCNGFFQKRFYPEDIKLPMLLIAGSDLLSNLVIYVITFLFRSRFDFVYYLRAIIIPEFVYTMVITIFLYFILLNINRHLEVFEKRRAIKFDL